MKRRLHANNQDSLELLLDTLCNVFGGIILIACLLAMLSRPTSDIPADTPGLTETIAKARSELDGLQNLRARLQSEDSPEVRALMKELEALKKTAETRKQERAEQAAEATEKAEHAVKDADDAIARLRIQEQSQQKKLGLINEATKTAQERMTALGKRLADLQLDLERTDGANTEKVRFPRERPTGKSAAPLILRHGEIHPVFKPGSAGTPAVGGARTPDGNLTALPQPGQGLQPGRDDARLRALLPALTGSSRYLTIYVYPDSYPAMRALKRIILELGLQYGLDLCTEHEVLIFSATGEKPKPL